MKQGPSPVAQMVQDVPAAWLSLPIQTLRPATSLVALKFLRSDAWPRAASTQGRKRFLREARAMAKLSHPNVLAVHEVGRARGLVFIAMEFAPGGTLSDWCEEKERSWKEIVAMFGSRCRWRRVQETTLSSRGSGLICSSAWWFGKVANWRLARRNSPSRSSADSPVVIATYVALGSAYHAKGDTKKARIEFEQALAIAERAQRPPQRFVSVDRHAVAQLVNNIATALRELGRRKEAVSYLEHAAVLEEEIGGPESPGLARPLTNLGSVLVELGEFEAAEKHFLRALGILERALGKEHFYVSYPLLGLAELYVAMMAIPPASLRSSTTWPKRQVAKQVLASLDKVDHGKALAAKIRAWMKRSGLR